MKLSNRLFKIASLVTKNKRIADIGTDHGYIPAYLLKNNYIEYAILADINKGPLENAKKEIEYNNLQDKVSLRLGSGLEILQVNEVDEVIIAGMGGVLIGEILEKRKNVAKSLERLILQPMQSQEELRKYLLNNGYEIIEEKLVNEDFRIYEIIVAKYTGKNTILEDDIYYEVSKKLIENKDILLKEFLDKKINSYNTTLSKINNNNSEKLKEKIDNISLKIDKLIKIKNSI